MAIKQWILHDWSDEECVKILKNCKEAIPSKDKGGKVIIIDMVMKNQPEGDDSDDKAIETQLFFDMLMMVLTKGRERNEKEWAKLFFEAGFSGYKINPVFGLRSLIEIEPKSLTPFSLATPIATILLFSSPSHPIIVGLED
ncbi:hypothetical protein ACH5RR_028670 [Cinchona calisaya]|uniref:O-methyltransferase C-terminal domain-containing protein n=1 Tax=Cinchona calisaya TaxID=153742 RepID=A0ABD2YRA2_9GENT